MIQPETEFDSLSDHELLVLAADWLMGGHGLALVFVMKTWGSSPRQAGAVMIIRDDMVMAGSVSGGCIEGAVTEAAMQVMESGTGRRLDFGVADETAWSVGLSCGGSISVLVVPVNQQGLPPAELKAIAEALQARQPLSVMFDSGTGQFVHADYNKTAVRHGLSTLDEDQGRFCFVQPPPPHLIIIGAVHITQHLAAMASQCGFQTSIIDPRGIFADEKRFPAATRLFADWPEDVLADMPLDSSTALVTLTHDPKIDDDALHIALKAPLFYIACLGSRATHKKRLERLHAAGFSDRQCQMIHGPAGLAIGAGSPAEIAVSVLGELISVWRTHLAATETGRAAQG